MYRFIAYMWPSTDMSAAVNAHVRMSDLRSPDSAWSLAHQGPGITVFDYGNEPGTWERYALKDGKGVILGRVFRSRGSSLSSVYCDTSSDWSSAEATHRSLKDFSSSYWGRYVGLVASAPAAHVFRDPTGTMPCFFHQQGNLVTIFSHMSDFQRLYQAPLSINWRYMEAFLRFPGLAHSDTGFTEISGVRAGECVSLRFPSYARRFFWIPADLCQRHSSEDRLGAAARLRDSVSDSVNSWSSCYKRIVVELSGGLDSSIVLGCLREAASKPDLVALNFFTTAREGDEREFARLAASRADCELVEAPFECRTTRLDEMLSVEICPSPVHAALTAESEAYRERLTRARAASAIFTGRGGDNVFHRRRTALAPAEYVGNHALGRDLLRILLEAAHLSKRSLWSVIGECAHYILLRRKFDPYELFQPASFFDLPAERLDESYVAHPWVVEAKNLPPSKRLQIFDLVTAQHFYSIGCTYADVVHPLISQPVLETVLQIPTYTLTDGGRERALARNAFRALLPPSIVDRTSKGAVSGYFIKLVEENLNFIREFLLDGTLAHEGLIERAALEAALGSTQRMRGTELQPLLRAIVAEGWLRTSMQSRARRAA